MDSANIIGRNMLNPHLKVFGAAVREQPASLRGIEPETMTLNSKPAVVHESGALQPLAIRRRVTQRPEQLAPHGMGRRRVSAGGARFDNQTEPGKTTGAACYSNC